MVAMDCISVDIESLMSSLRTMIHGNVFDFCSVLQANLRLSLGRPRALV